MSIVLVRVDDRLVHGQIVEAWVPSCKATCIIVASDEAKKNCMQKTAIESCASKTLRIKVEGIEESIVDATSDSRCNDRIIIVFATLKDLMQAYNRGLRFACINIGNIHHDIEGKRLAPSVYVNKDDETILQTLLKLGVKLDVRAVPSDKPVKIVVSGQ